MIVVNFISKILKKDYYESDEEYRRKIYERTFAKGIIDNPKLTYKEVEFEGERNPNLSTTCDGNENALENNLLSLCTFFMCFFLLYSFNAYFWPQYAMLYNLLFLFLVTKFLFKYNRLSNYSYFKNISCLLEKEGINKEYFILRTHENSYSKQVLYEKPLWFRNLDGTQSLCIFYFISHLISTMIYFIGYCIGSETLQGPYVSFFFELIFNINFITFFRRALPKIVIVNENNNNNNLKKTNSQNSNNSNNNLKNSNNSSASEKSIIFNNEKKDKDDNNSSICEYCGQQLLIGEDELNALHLNKCQIEFLERLKNHDGDDDNELNNNNNNNNNYDDNNQQDSNRTITFSMSELWYWTWLYMVIDWSTFGFKLDVNQYIYTSILIILFFYSYYLLSLYDINGKGWMTLLLWLMFPYSIVAISLPGFNDVSSFGHSIGTFMSLFSLLLIHPKMKNYICKRKGIFMKLIKVPEPVEIDEFKEIFPYTNAYIDFSSNVGKGLNGRHEKLSQFIKISNLFLSNLKQSFEFFISISKIPKELILYHAYFMLILIFLQLIHCIGIIYNFYFSDYWYILTISWILYYVYILLYKTAPLTNNMVLTNDKKTIVLSTQLVHKNIEFFIRKLFYLKKEVSIIKYIVIIFSSFFLLFLSYFLYLFIKYI